MARKVVAREMTWTRIMNDAPRAVAETAESEAVDMPDGNDCCVSYCRFSSSGFCFVRSGNMLKCCRKRNKLPAPATEHLKDRMRHSLDYAQRFRT